MDCESCFLILFLHSGIHVLSTVHLAVLALLYRWASIDCTSLSRRRFFNFLLSDLKKKTLSLNFKSCLQFWFYIRSSSAMNREQGEGEEVQAAVQPWVEKMWKCQGVAGGAGPTTVQQASWLSKAVWGNKKTLSYTYIFKSGATKNIFKFVSKLQKF